MAGLALRTGETDTAMELFEALLKYGEGLNSREKNDCVIWLLLWYDARIPALSAVDRPVIIQEMISLVNKVDESAPLANCTLVDCPNCTRKREVFHKWKKMANSSPVAKKEVTP